MQYKYVLIGADLSNSWTRYSFVPNEFFIWLVTPKFEYATFAVALSRIIPPVVLTTTQLVGAKTRRLYGAFRSGWSKQGNQRCEWSGSEFV